MDMWLKSKSYAIKEEHILMIVDDMWHVGVNEDVELWWTNKLDVL